MAVVGVRGEAGSADRRQQYGEALHFREVAHCLPPLVRRSLLSECVLGVQVAGGGPNMRVAHGARRGSLGCVVLQQSAQLR